jgi:tetratricopeptide (TPR) repeat protein
MDTLFDGKAIAAFSGAYIAVVGLLVTIVAWLAPKGFDTVPWEAWICISFVMLYAIGFLVTLLVRAENRLQATAATALVSVPHDLQHAIPEILRQALDRSDYREVVRLGDALARPLFESGEFTVRLQVGRMTEEAAAHIGAADVQYRTLIDSIGWSLIELGKFDEASTEIQHGLELAQEAGDDFYSAKSYRHMGAIARREGDLDLASDMYQLARTAAARIVDPGEAKAMEAGIMYAIAHLEYSRRNLQAALSSINETIALFTQLHDVYRQDMAVGLKADIQLAMNQPGPAADSYRKVIQSSKVNREAVHYIRAVLGLSELYIHQRRFDEADRLVARLDPVHVDEMPAFAARLKSVQDVLDARAD